jgi:hypothetical protein
LFRMLLLYALCDLCELCVKPFPSARKAFNTEFAETTEKERQESESVLFQSVAMSSEGAGRETIPSSSRFCNMAKTTAAAACMASAKIHHPGF